MIISVRFSILVLLNLKLKIIIFEIIKLNEFNAIKIGQGLIFKIK